MWYGLKEKIETMVDIFDIFQRMKYIRNDEYILNYELRNGKHINTLIMNTQKNNWLKDSYLPFVFKRW